MALLAATGLTSPISTENIQRLPIKTSASSDTTYGIIRLRSCPDANGVMVEADPFVHLDNKQTDSESRYRFPPPSHYCTDVSGI